MTRRPLYTVLALTVLFLTAVPVGIAVFVLGFGYGDSPCVMCWEQRIGMALVALNGLFILRYGPRPRYIGLAILTGVWGIHMGVRHSSLHLARDIGQGFSLEILGAHTYTWSVLIFWVCVVTMGLLLLWLRDDDPATAPGPFRPLESMTAGVFVVVIAANAVQAFVSTGPPPYMGQGDPVRFSFNPQHWVWSLEEWDTRTPITWRGRWNVPKPTLDGRVANPDDGPLTGTTEMTVRERLRLTAPLDGLPTDFAYDAATDRFLVTTSHGIYLIDGSLSRVVRGTVVDPGYSVDLSTFVGAAFLDSHTVAAISDNKSFVVLREAGTGDADANFRFFLSSPDQFAHVSRSRLTTVRARLHYIMSAAFDPASDSLLTVTVPHASSRRLIVSRFARADMTLSEEFQPTVAPASGLTARGTRTPGDYYVTGTAVGGTTLFALSAAHSTLLSIDLASRQIVGARTVPGLARPVGLALKGTQFLILQEDGTVIVTE